MQKKILVFVLTMLSVGNILIQPTQGVEPFEIICSMPAGGPTDLMARLVADIAPKYLGQPIIVINQPGASGSIAAADVASSKPGSKAFTITQFYFATTIRTQKLPFGRDDFVPLGGFMRYKTGLMVRGDSPWKTLSGLLDYGKKNPGKLRYAHPGRGTPIHMAGLMIFRKAGVEMIDVPYKGAPELLAALLGGHVDVVAMVWGGAMDHVKVGKIRCLVVLTDQRYTDPADVPCATELGFPEAAVFTSVIGLYAHRDTPGKYKQALTDAFKKTCADPEFKKGIEKIGEEHRCWGPETVKEAIKKAEEVGIPILMEFGLLEK